MFGRVKAVAQAADISQSEKSPCNAKVNVQWRNMRRLVSTSLEKANLERSEAGNRSPTDIAQPLATEETDVRLRGRKKIR
jgi:hypothetical protein